MPSVMQRVGTPNGRHNLDNQYRKHLDNVDPTLTRYNEVVRRKSVEEIYQEHLQLAFEAFNDKQKRRDRRLDVKYGCTTYLEYQRALDKQARESKNFIDQKGRPPIREIVWQFGNPEQGYGSAGQTDESRQKIKDMLLEVQAEAERRYPQFIWGDCVFHADEVTEDAEGKERGSLHLHSSFVPICLKNKQGTEVQVAFERCLREMGFATFEAWKHDLDNIMEQVLEKHDLERVLMDNHERHQDSKQFHRQQKLIKQTKELQRENEALKAENHDLVEVVEYLQDKVDSLIDQVNEQGLKLSDMDREKDELQGELKSIKEEKTKLQADIDTLQTVLTPEQVEALQHEKGLLKTVKMPFKDYQQLRNTAAKVDDAEARATAAEARADEAVEKMTTMENLYDQVVEKETQRLNEIYQEALDEWQREHPSFKLQEDNANLRKRLEEEERKRKLAEEAWRKIQESIAYARDFARIVVETLERYPEAKKEVAEETKKKPREMVLHVDIELQKYVDRMQGTTFGRQAEINQRLNYLDDMHHKYGYLYHSQVEEYLHLSRELESLTGRGRKLPEQQQQKEKGYSR